MGMLDELTEESVVDGFDAEFPGVGSPNTCTFQPFIFTAESFTMENVAEEGVVQVYRDLLILMIIPR